MKAKFRTVNSGDSYRMNTKKQLIHRCCNCGHITHIKFKILGKVYLRMDFSDKPFREEKAND